MAADADDEIVNVAEGNDDGGDDDLLLDVDERTAWFSRVKRCLKDEVTLLARCIRAVSPDRSSAAVLFLVLFSVSLTCMLCNYLKPGRFPNYVVPWLIIGFEALATVPLSVFC